MHHDSAVLPGDRWADLVSAEREIRDIVRLSSRSRVAGLLNDFRDKFAFVGMPQVYVLRAPLLIWHECFH